MSVDEVKNQIRSNIKFEVHPKQSGGQNVSMPSRGQKLISEELGIELIVNSGSSMYKNKELAIKLFEIALNDLIV